MDFTAEDGKYMARALQLAKDAGRNNEVPVGAVLVHEGRIIGEGSNNPISSHDVSAHAELVAIRQACLTMSNYRLPNSTLYVSLEPCPMCAGAIVHARIARVVIATEEPRAGAAGSVFNLLDNPNLNHRCTVEYGLYEQESSDLLKAFFKRRRAEQKEARRVKESIQ